MKTVTVTVTTDGPDAGQIAVETSGFAGKGCEAIHNAFASGGNRISFTRKPEWNATQAKPQTQGK